MESLENIAQNSYKSALKGDFTSKERKKLSREIATAMTALVFLAAGYIYKNLFPDRVLVSGMIYLVGVLIEGIPILCSAIKGFLNKDITNAMEILVSIAIIACFIDAQHELAILIPVILTVVHFFEERSIMGGKDAIEGLKKMQSKTAILMTDEGEKTVDASTLACDDVIIVKPGMSLPIDGVVVNGETNINQQSLTGEPLPKAIIVGDNVFAGTINIDGVIKVKVKKTFQDTSFKKILNLLENSEKISIPEMRLIDKSMHYYIPFALLVAAAVALVTKDVSRAIAVLVVSCPCAQMLISSAPMIASLAISTKRGILIKNSKFVEDLTNINCILFDKTGTITKGDLDIVDCKLINCSSKQQLINIAANVAQSSLHPISKAVMRNADENSVDTTYTVKEIIGKGMIGKKQDDTIIFGSTVWLKTKGYIIEENVQSDGPVNWVVKNGVVLGCLMFNDTIREYADEVISDLKDVGIKQTVLLTGDTKQAAEKIGNNVCFDTIYAQLLPENKLDYVKQYKKDGNVIVVGDGINDALALSEANVGISMGAMGSDTAIQSSDIALMNNDLSNIPFVLRLAKLTKKIMYQNIVIAFSISFLMITLSALGIISALIGAFLHNIGAFLILLNSSRILMIDNNK